MRQASRNKMLTLAGRAQDPDDEDKLTPFEEEAARRFPDTPRHKLRQRMFARSRRRARNKMRRVSRRLHRDST